MTLRELLDQYLLENVLSDGAARNLRHAVDSFDCYVRAEQNREAGLGDFTARTFNLWLVAIAKQLAENTIIGYRGRLLTLWRYAHRIELLDEWPSRVRSFKRRPGNPDSWEDDEVARMVLEASRYSGYLCSPKAQGIPRSGFLVSLIAIVHAAGPRWEDIQRFGWHNLRGETLSWVQHKTNKPMARPLPGWVVALIVRTFPRTRPTWFGGVISYNRVRLYFGQITERAGVQGTLRKLRRTSGNAVEEKHPGFGHRHLGNTPAVFAAYYADQSRLGMGVPSPEPLPAPDPQSWLF